MTRIAPELRSTLSRDPTTEDADAAHAGKSKSNVGMSNEWRGVDNAAAKARAGKADSGWRESEMNDSKRSGSLEADGAADGANTGISFGTTPAVKKALSDPAVLDAGKALADDVINDGPLGGRQFVSSVINTDFGAGAQAATLSPTALAARPGADAGNGINKGVSLPEDQQHLANQLKDMLFFSKMDDVKGKSEDGKADGSKTGGGSSKAAVKSKVVDVRDGSVSESGPGAPSDGGAGRVRGQNEYGSGGIAGLSGMELVQAVMLAAAQEASKTAEGLAKQVQESTSKKNEYRAQMETIRSSIGAIGDGGMTDEQQAKNTELTNLQDNTDAIGDDNQILFIKLQNATQQYTTMLQGCSNVSKSLFDTEKALVGQIGR